MKKFSKLQISRFITQIVFLVLFPGLFTLTFSEVKEIYTMVLNGNFNFIEAFPKLIEVLALIPLTIIFGRFFCGWMCAFGTFNDIIYLFSKKVFKIKFKVSEELDSALKYIKFLLLVIIVVAMWTFGITVFEGSNPWDAFAQMTNLSEAINSYAIGCAILAFIIVGAMFIERFFCRYLCPLGAVFAITSKIRIFNINKPKDKCGKCRMCTNNCAMGIPLYEIDKVKSSECINCLKCVTVCPRKNAQAAIFDENINPAMGSAVAVAAFAGMYSLGNVLANNADTSLTNGTAISSTQNGTSSSSSVTYKDGTYTGTGNGYRPNLQVSVTIKNDKITAIKIGSNNETPSYASRPFTSIPQAIIKAQSTDVDTISGATRTCIGIIMAVEDALNDAK
jgi:polyferredoxin